MTATETKQPKLKLRADGQPARSRGSGSIFLMKNCANWILRYTDASGRQRTESSGTPDFKKAERILRARLVDKDRGDLLGARSQRVTIEELVNDVFEDYAAKGQKSIPDIKIRWERHLEPTFGGKFRACKLTSDHVRDYVRERQKAGSATATINRDLALLKRALHLGMQATPAKVKVVPHIPTLREDNVRMQFITPQEFERLAAEASKVGLWMRAMLACGYDLGWRHRELLSLRVKQFDKIAGTVELERGASKNKRARKIGVTPTVRELLRLCVAGKGSNDFVFTREHKTREGETEHTPIRGFRKAWYLICCRAGVGKLLCRVCGTETMPIFKRNRWCPTCKAKRRNDRLKYEGLIFHSLRRSCARDCVDAGIPQHVIMEIAGWRTDSMFRRYAIVDTRQTQTAMSKLEAKRTADREQIAAQAAAFVSNSCQAEPETVQNRVASADQQQLLN